MLDAACAPRATCRPSSCGLLTCDCKSIPIHARTPWAILVLNVSSALDPQAIHLAFDLRAETLAPDRNYRCLKRARSAFASTRRARDTLLMLAAVKMTADMGTTRTTQEQQHQHQMQPHSKSADSQRQRSSGVGTRIPIIIALKLALYRHLREQRSKVLKGWSALFIRARRALHEVIRVPGRIFFSIARFCLVHRGAIFASVLSGLLFLVFSIPPSLIA